jgi:general stress protein YciG
MNAREMARALGRRGGRSRAQRLDAERKKQIAAVGGSARARSLEAARRIDANLRYAAAVAVLRGPANPVVRMKRFGGRLPGIYRGRP